MGPLKHITITLLSIFSQTHAEETPVAEASVILMDSSGSIIPLPEANGIRGFPAQIDFTQLPNLGYPKDEVRIITILKRSKVSYQGNTLIFEPDYWEFDAPSWQVIYKGKIPYLTELKFLGPHAAKVRTLAKIQYHQNNRGYFFNTNNNISGIYDAIHRSLSNTVEKIIIIPAEENKIIETMRLKLYSSVETEIQENLQEGLEITDNKSKIDRIEEKYPTREISPPIRTKEEL